MVLLALAGLFASVFAGVARSAPGDVTATQVAEINTTGSINSSPAGLTNVNGTLLFSASDGTSGRELWKSNGGALGPGGTEMVEDINGLGGSDPESLTNINGTLFFSADDATNGRELWKSVLPYDAATTSIVKNINPLAGNSTPDFLTNVNGTLFFVADDGTNGFELWKSVPPYDATTTTIIDINTGMGEGGEPMDLANVNGTLFFSADDGGGSGAELWKSNGGAVGPGGTEMVADINTTASVHSEPGKFTNVNGTLFFTADDGINGRELFKSESPYTTLTQVENINPTGDGLDQHGAELMNLNGTLFFSATDATNGGELWKSVAPYDAAATSMVANINTTPNPSASSSPDNLADFNGTLFFRASNGTNGFELWKSTGGPLGPGGTEMAAEIRSGSNGSDPDHLTEFGGTLVFKANNGTNGDELFKSTGTGATMTEINPGGGGSGSQFFTAVDNTLFFAASGGNAVGGELWRATIEGPALPVSPGAPAPPKKKCKKGRKLKKGKCVKKKRKKK